MPTIAPPLQRVALFAHYDGQGEVKPYIVELLRRLQPHCAEILFVSTAGLSEAELAKVQPFCSRSIAQPNLGYDFCMWQAALRELDLAAIDELLLTNSSVFGPLVPLGPAFERMTASNADFWGMTDNFAMAWHLQSYFLVLKKRVLCSPSFARFFASVLPYEDKWQVVRSYELGLTQFLVEQGFAAAAFAPVGCWLDSPTAVVRLREARLDSTLFFPLELLQAGMPFVKALLLRENPGRVALQPVLRAMRARGYDTSLIRFDRPAQPLPAKLGHRLSALFRRSP